MNQASVLIVSDDIEFARTIVGRWQAEPHAPEITLVTSDVWHSVSGSGCDLVMIGPVRHGELSSILTSVSAMPGAAAVYLAEDEKDIPLLHEEHPHVVIVPRQDGWAGILIVVSIEVLRRADAVARAHRAERLALGVQRDATLGRYMLEMRPSVNNALTSVIGNADLLLLEPGQLSRDSREQIRAIHSMALRLNEIMQRFSSLATEMRAGETTSQAETEDAAPPLAARP